MQDVASSEQDLILDMDTLLVCKVHVFRIFAALVGVWTFRQAEIFHVREERGQGKCAADVHELRPK